MLQKILIANRGEIAVRIIQACHELGIQTVAVFSKADRQALHVQFADEAYCIGEASASDSYLNMERILQVAVITGADGIHPGYGFLAENADFANLCQELNIVFIGPSAASIRGMGIKDAARTKMESAGVPIVPGSDGVVEDVEEGKNVANEIGYPVMIKATAGGGGKGIRVAYNETELVQGMDRTQQEAATAFGDPSVYLERFVEHFRHVEIQVLADAFGTTIHLGERDCTIQRRMQKLIEETPSPAISNETSAKMGEAAVKAAQAVSYVGAGTVEFIYEPATGKFYFMEMNTRVQVEHPITEMVTGVDIVQEQIRIASGLPLQINQEEVELTGHAMECRINAEDPSNHFMPYPGTITQYVVPGGFDVRVDSAVYAGDRIQPFYDSMIAKLIVHAKTRDEAIAKMKRALRQFTIKGVKTTIPFHQTVLQDDVFKSGEFHTDFLEKRKLEEGK